MSRLGCKAAWVATALCLVAFFFSLWCGLRVSWALNHGALEKATICFDAGHFPKEVAGTVPQRTVDTVLARQVWSFYYFGDGQRSIPHHLLLASSYWGWKLFWTKDQRRSIYKSFTPKMGICPGTLENLKRSGELTPGVLAAARARYADQGRPFPDLDRIRPSEYPSRWHLPQ